MALAQIRRSSASRRLRIGSETYAAGVIPTERGEKGEALAPEPRTDELSERPEALRVILPRAEGPAVLAGAG